MKKIIILLIVLIVGVLGYFGYKNLDLLGLKKAPNGPTVEKIIQRGTLIVGTDATYPPLESIGENGEIVGFDVDLAKEIGKQMGVEVKLVDISFDNIFTRLEKGDIDMIMSSVTITPARAEKYAFSNPYFNAGQAIVVNKTNTTIKGVVELKGKKIGIQPGTTSQEEALRYTNKELVLEYPDYLKAASDLLLNKIDAMIMDYPAGVGLVQETPQLQVVGGPFTQEFYGVVIRKDESDLAIFVNQSLSKLKSSGKLVQIQKNWGL